jgi:uncharacterized protein YbjT (DUF2867 family)
MGVTGQVGAAVAMSLLANGKRVRAIVRNPEKAKAWRERGAEIAIADFNDAATLEAAFRSVEGVFAMLPPSFAPEPGFPESRATIAALRKALLGAQPPRVVYLSSIGAQQETGLGLITILHILEQECKSLPIAGAFLRAGWFMENALWDVPSARDDGKVFSFLQPLDKRFSLVSSSDVGRVAADKLLQNWNGSRFIEVAGPESYSPRDLAVAFAVALNRPVEAIAVPRDEWEDAFVKQGTLRERTANRIAMLDAFNSGWIGFGVQGTEHIKGTIPLQKVVSSLVAQS